MTGVVVALLGAESTGKTTLALALAERFATLPGFEPGDVGVVGEALRTFCDHHGRTPRAEEQAGIADEQMRRIEQARRHHRVVVADTTAVMIAVYSLFVFGDRSLHAQALGAHRDRIDATLVTALDLPWVADGLQRDGPHVREPVDRLLRLALAEGGIAHSVVRGDGALRLQAAWRAIGPLRRVQGWTAGEEGLGPPAQGSEADSHRRAAPGPGRWRALCECCADPEAEAADFRLRRPRRP